MWNERYAQPGFLFGTEPAQFLRTHENFLQPGKSALAIADGEGRNSVFLAQKGMHVTAFDYSDVALKKARSLAAKKQVAVDYQQSCLESWNWEGRQYDFVIAIFFQFLSPGERTKIFSNFTKALMPGGVLMLHGYTPKQISFGTGGPKAIENLYTIEMLEFAFADMQILHLKAYEVEIDEGEGHSGMSALIDLVARKT